MRFFLSGEIDIQVNEPFSRVQNAIEAKLNLFFAEREYGSALKKIAIIPMIRLSGRLDIGSDDCSSESKGPRTTEPWIDFEKMRAGPDDVRERLLLRNIIEAIDDLSRKAGKAFAGDRLAEEILTLFGVTRSELDDV